LKNRLTGLAETRREIATQARRAKPQQIASETTGGLSADVEIAARFGAEGRASAEASRVAAIFAAKALRGGGAEVAAKERGIALNVVVADLAELGVVATQANVFFVRRGEATAHGVVILRYAEVLARIGLPSALIAMTQGVFVLALGFTVGAHRGLAVGWAAGAGLAAFAFAVATAAGRAVGGAARAGLAAFAFAVATAAGRAIGGAARGGLAAFTFAVATLGGAALAAIRFAVGARLGRSLTLVVAAVGSGTAAG